ncbi:HA1F protein, partial [Eubucco bourcierii]|nr:HA1F protein [Eubucco bourcierii]
PGPGLPQYIEVGYVDGIPISRYDSTRRRHEPQREWMKANLDQQYWDGQTQIAQSNQEVGRESLDIV